MGKLNFARAVARTSLRSNFDFAIAKTSLILRRYVVDERGSLSDNQLNSLMSHTSINYVLYLDEHLYKLLKTWYNEYAKQPYYN